MVSLGALYFVALFSIACTKIILAILAQFTSHSVLICCQVATSWLRFWLVSSNNETFDPKLWWSSDSMPVFLDHYLLNSCQRAQLLSVCCPTCVCIDVFVSRWNFFVLPRIRTIFSHYGTLKFSFPQPFSNVFRFRTACWFWEWALFSNVVDVLGLEFIVCPKKKK